MLVRKRDGGLEQFDSNKMFESVIKAIRSVERKDVSIQNMALKVYGLREQLLDAGFSIEEANREASIGLDGYIDKDGVYTECNSDDAAEVVDTAFELLEANGYNANNNIMFSGNEDTGSDESDNQVITSEFLQSIMEKALVLTEHTKTAKEFMVNRVNRERIREMHSSLMRSYENLTFGSSESVESTRENANIDGDTAMGTMLKYGSEGAKRFNLLNLVPVDISEAHSRGDIHIHDLDFLALTETCITGDTKVCIKDTNTGRVNIRRAEDFNEVLINYPDDTWVDLRNLEIKSKGEYVRLKRCSRHRVGNRKLLEISAGNIGYIRVTSDHKLPIVIGNIGDELQTTDTMALNVQTGDILLYEGISGLGLTMPVVIDSINEMDITDIDYVYDFETENSYFSANGFTVHNCCQIDLEKLFTGGFNTGHGFLREPGEIRSYAALACIAIQSNQNDQHRGDCASAS